MRTLLSYLLCIVFFLSCSGKEEYKPKSEKKIMDLTFILEDGSKPISLAYNENEKDLATRLLLSEIVSRFTTKKEEVDVNYIYFTVSKAFVIYKMGSSGNYGDYTIKGTFKMNTLTDLITFNHYLNELGLKITQAKNPNLSKDRVRRKFYRAVVDRADSMNGKKEPIVSLKFGIKGGSISTPFAFSKQQAEAGFANLTQYISGVQTNLIKKGENEFSTLNTVRDIQTNISFIQKHNIKLIREEVLWLETLAGLGDFSTYLESQCFEWFKDKCPTKSTEELKQLLNNTMKDIYNQLFKKAEPTFGDDDFGDMPNWFND